MPATSQPCRTLPVCDLGSQSGYSVRGGRSPEALEENPAIAIGIGGDGIVLSGLRYEASTICSNEAWSMTWLLTSVISIRRSETWKWRAAAWMSSSPGSSVSMYA